MENLRNTAYHWLRRSEGFFKTDMVYLAKGGFWLTAGQVVSSISTFLLAIAFANLLLPETYGTYKYILSIAGILAIPTLGGLNTAVVQAVSRGYEGSFIPSLKIKIRWGLLGGTASLGLAGYYFLNDNIELTISFLLISVFLPFMDSFSLYTSFLQGKKLFKLSTSFNIASSIIATCIMIGTLFLTDNLFFILLSYFTSWTILYFIFLQITLKKFHPNHDHDPKTISYGKHLSLIGVIGVIAGQLDKILIFHFLGAAEVAIYFIATAPVEQMKGLFKDIPTLAVPKLSQRSTKEIDHIFISRLSMLLLVGTTITVIYVLFVPFLFHNFFPKYTAAIIITQLFSITIVLRIPFMFMSAIVQAKLNIWPTQWLYWSTLSQVVFIIFLFVLLPLYGIVGAVLSKILFLLVANSVVFFQWKLFIKRNVHNTL